MREIAFSVRGEVPDVVWPLGGRDGSTERGLRHTPSDRAPSFPAGREPPRTAKER